MELPVLRNGVVLSCHVTCYVHATHSTDSESILLIAEKKRVVLAWRHWSKCDVWENHGEESWHWALLWLHCPNILRLKRRKCSNSKFKVTYKYSTCMRHALFCWCFVISTYAGIYLVAKISAHMAQVPRPAQHYGAQHTLTSLYQFKNIFSSVGRNKNDKGCNWASSDKLRKFLCDV